MHYTSIIIAILASVFYSIFQDAIPSNINPLIALCCMYFSSALISLIFYFKTKKQMDKQKIKKDVDWRTAALSFTNIAIDYGFLMAFRVGWQIGILNTTSNIIVLIILAIIGVTHFKEKLTIINIMGIGLGIVGLFLLGF